MTEAQFAQLNTFFVRTFNAIQSLEDRALSHAGVTDLSVRELHTLEAAAELAPSGRNTMSSIAARLRVSVGALTTAVGVMVKKGYLVRVRRPDDRRLVFIEPTEAGLRVNRIHAQFHKDMIACVSEQLDDTSLQVLCAALGRLADYFDGCAQK